MTFELNNKDMKNDMSSNRKVKKKQSNLSVDKAWIRRHF